MGFPLARTWADWAVTSRHRTIIVRVPGGPQRDAGVFAWGKRDVVNDDERPGTERTTTCTGSAHARMAEARQGPGAGPGGRREVSRPPQVAVLRHHEKPPQGDRAVLLPAYSPASATPAPPAPTQRPACEASLTMADIQAALEAKAKLPSGRTLQNAVQFYLDYPARLA